MNTDKQLMLYESTRMKFVNLWKIFLIFGLFFQCALMAVYFSSSALSAENDDNGIAEEMSIALRNRMIKDDKIPRTPYLLEGTVSLVDKPSIGQNYNKINDLERSAEQERHFKRPSAVEITRQEAGSRDRVSGIKQTEWEQDGRQRDGDDAFSNDKQPTKDEAESSPLERRLQETFREKTLRMKRRFRSQFGRDPLPVQVFTGKRLLTKLLRVPGSRNDDGRRLIVDLVTAAMASESRINDTKLSKVRDLVGLKLSWLIEQLQIRDGSNADNMTAVTAVTGVTTEPTTASTAVRNRETADVVNDVTVTATQTTNYGEKRGVSDDVIGQDDEPTAPVIDLSSHDDDDGHVLDGGAEAFELRCRDRLTGVEHRRSVFRLDERYVIGYVSDHVSDYVAVSVGLADEQSFRYVFSLPLTVLANRRIGFETVVILANGFRNYVDNAGLRHVLSRLCQLGAVVVFLPSRRVNTVLVSQTSRLFAASLLFDVRNRLKSESGLDVPRLDAKYVVVSDSDMWTLKRSVLSLPTNASVLVRSALRNRTITEGGRQYEMYPLSGTGMRAAFWRHLLDRYGRVPPDMTITADNIVRLFVDRFGPVANRTTRRSGKDEGWFLDQRFLSLIIQNYAEEYGPGNVYFLNGKQLWKPRIDKRAWPNVDQITQDMMDNAKQVHLITVNSDQTWHQVTVILEKMYGANSEEYSWCLDYYKEYREKAKYMRIENISWEQ